MRRDMLRMMVPLALAASLAGCGKKAPVAAAAAPPPAAPAAPRAETRPAEDANAAEVARRARERAMTSLLAKVYFDYDDAQIRSDARTILDEKARVLRDEPNVRVRIEGHADERGSTEYNQALSSRRARAVAAYLEGFGIAASRLETVGFGEERPADGGHDERAWGQNRRAEFSVVAGGFTLNDAAPR